MVVTGEAIYKASARITKYGVKAYIKMLGKTARKAAMKRHGGMEGLIAFYHDKYPGAPLELPPKAPSTSESMRKYWKNVKMVAEGRNISINEARKMLKEEKVYPNVRIRITRTGKGWQLEMTGLYERREKFGEPLEAPYEVKEATGYSYMCREELLWNCNSDQMKSECETFAQGVLGSSGWKLVKVLKVTFYRYFGRLDLEDE